MKEKEEGIYDDCNWKNKNKAYQINDGSWINAAHIMLSDSIMKQQQDLMFHDFLVLGQVDIDFHAAQARENLLKKQMSTIWHGELSDAKLSIIGDPLGVAVNNLPTNSIIKKPTPLEDWKEGVDWIEQENSK